jgi:hypothetical protein
LWVVVEEATKAKKSFNQKDIQALVTKIEKTQKPPEDVLTVCMCVMILQPISTPYSGTGTEAECEDGVQSVDWEGLKVMFDDKGLYKALKDYNIHQADEVLQIQPIRELMNLGAVDDKSKFDKVVRKFDKKAADGLLQWVQEVVKYHDLKKEYHDLKTIS